VVEEAEEDLVGLQEEGIAESGHIRAVEVPLVATNLRQSGIPIHQLHGHREEDLAKHGQVVGLPVVHLHKITDMVVELVLHPLLNTEENGQKMSSLQAGEVLLPVVVEMLVMVEVAVVAMEVVGTKLLVGVVEDVAAEEVVAVEVVIAVVVANSI